MRRYVCFIPWLVLASIQHATAETIAERDPTLPAVVMPVNETKKEESLYLLHSTIISPTRRLALVIAVPANALDKPADEFMKISDFALGTAKYVAVGDKVGDATVLSIEKSAIVLSWGGRKQTVYLFEHKGMEKHT